MKILVVDNYDSFTYNLVYIVRQVYPDVAVYRNDKITPLECLAYDAIILSPGPGLPKDAGHLMGIIKACSTKIPILGVCLGHQAIVEYLGGKLKMLNKVYHGIQSTITLQSDHTKLFKDIPSSFQAGRYHSWDIVPKQDSNYEIIAVSEDKSIMAIQNTKQKLYGIQFHPESILTPNGEKIINNFLTISKDLLP